MDGGLQGRSAAASAGCGHPGWVSQWSASLGRMVGRVARRHRL